MPLFDDFHRLFFGLGNRLAAFRFDQNTEQRVGIEHGLGQCDRHDDQFVGIHAQPLADGFEHADDAQAAVTDPNELADGRFVAEQFFTDRVADDGDRRAAIPVFFRQALALGQFKIADGNEVGGGAGNHDFTQSAAEADFGSANGERGNPADCACPAQGGRIVDGQVARRGRDGVGGIETAGPGAAGQDDDEIGADRGELADDVAPCAIAKGGEDDDGGNAD